MTHVVLVVDDDEDNRQLLAEVLRTRGFTVTTSESGASCLAAIARAVGKISVVVTDVEMPGMTGLALCGQIDEKYPAIVSVVMSGRVTRRVALDAKRAGAFAFMAKPIDVDVLERILVNALST